MRTRFAMLAAVALALTHVGCALNARRRLPPELAAVRIELVGQRSQQPIAASQLVARGASPYGNGATDTTTCEGLAELRLPAGRWTIEVGPSAACAATRTFTVAVPQGESTELLAIDDGPESCPLPPPKPASAADALALEQAMI